eukprot:TRINITY_DN2345_c0_g1_i1.p2 TRINITY_DN2345_c0_g1~~TRINITY_DN2345_c0_g1_i1.p2  ORF type:complete len:276 (-),score=45.50 TRINITY_DN2345_c0_g1_i1:1489-2316(-)
MTKHHGEASFNYSHNNFSFPVALKINRIRVQEAGYAALYEMIINPRFKIIPDEMPPFSPNYGNQYYVGMTLVENFLEEAIHHDQLQIVLDRKTLNKTDFPFDVQAIRDIAPSLKHKYKYEDTYSIHCHANDAVIHGETRINKLAFESQFNCSLIMDKDKLVALTVRIGTMIVIQPYYNRGLHFRIDDVYAEFQKSFDPEIENGSSQTRVAINKLVGQLAEGLKGRKLIGSGLELGEFRFAYIKVTESYIWVYAPRTNVKELQINTHQRASKPTQY